VRQAENVSTGTKIGNVGSTGVTDAQNTPWLGFEIRYKKTAQDPMNWLRK
jgi:septal ring factor EnvC (AmiA/AmiB activator)